MTSPARSAHHNPPQERVRETRPRTNDLWPIVGLVVLVLLVLGRVATHEFLAWDDWLYVAGNPALRSPTFSALLSIWKSPETGLYIPLPYTLWWLTAQVALVPDGTGVWSLNPWLFHGLNLAIHAIAVTLAFRLLRALGGSKNAAFLGAACFGLHPLAVESVAWTMGLRDVLAGAFSIAALIASAKAKRWPMLLWLVLAILSKPTSIMIVPMAILIDVLLLDRRLKESVQRHWPSLIACAAGGVLAILYSPLIHANISRLWQRPLIALDAVAFYAAKLVWPNPLTFDYARTPTAIFASGAAYWTPIFPVLAVVALLLLRSRVLWAVFALFVLPLLPVTGLAPFAFQTISTVADHYAYLSLLAPALGIALLIKRFSRAGYALVPLICVWAGLSFYQAGFWRDDRTFFTHAVESDPHSAPAWNCLAAVEQRSGDLDAAWQDASRAVAVNPDYAFAHLTLVNLALIRQDKAAVDHELAELERTYRLQANFDPALAAAVHEMVKKREGH